MPLVTLLEEVTSLYDQEVDHMMSNLGDRGMSEVDAAILLNVWDRAFDKEAPDFFMRGNAGKDQRDSTAWHNLNRTVNW